MARGTKVTLLSMIVDYLGMITVIGLNFDQVFQKLPDLYLFCSGVCSSRWLTKEFHALVSGSSFDWVEVDVSVTLIFVFEYKELVVLVKGCSVMGSRCL